MITITTIAKHYTTWQSLCKHTHLHIFLFFLQGSWVIYKMLSDLEVRVLVNEKDVVRIFCPHTRDKIIKQICTYKLGRWILEGHNSFRTYSTCPNWNMPNWVHHSFLHWKNGQDLWLKFPLSGVLQLGFEWPTAIS